ncbi:MAG: hypothetical protein MJA28_08080 [Gammaproteobacteria bacterium]|nr:hypothetical protein [Gammaproteobacteria bacterium]
MIFLYFAWGGAERYPFTVRPEVKRSHLKHTEYHLFHAAEAVSGNHS